MPPIKPIYWKTKDGNLISVDDMSIEHLKNTLKMIIRNSKKPKEYQEIYPALNGDIADECDATESDIY